jgi:alkylhydroperoxidase family enzyme
VTREPSSPTAADLEGLREIGLTDAAIHDAIQVIAYFNYINRIADAVGVDDEPDWQ